MKKLLLVLSIALISINTTQAQTKVGDATLPNSVNFNSQDLVLNGAGIREKLWFDLYACGLYLPQKSKDASSIVGADKPMAIKLEILSSLVSKKKLLDAFKKGIDETNDLSDVKRLNDKINVFLQFIKDEIEIGNVYDIVYIPNDGLTLLKNSKALGKIEGLDFKKLLFNIWLASEPVDDDLKMDMLGK